MAHSVVIVFLENAGFGYSLFQCTIVPELQKKGGFSILPSFGLGQNKNSFSVPGLGFEEGIMRPTEAENFIQLLCSLGIAC